MLQYLSITKMDQIQRTFFFKRPDLRKRPETNKIRGSTHDLFVLAAK
jgi:hypothetical protein